MAATSTQGASQRPTIPHVDALDGLRGVAVIGVLLFHADHLSGGFLGVDLFFTLSGFLITSLLVVEHRRTGRISLRRFWARRARRLLPAMFAVVVGATVVARFTLPASELGRFRDQALLTLGYVANWGEIAASRDYWALFEVPTPLEHVWSLAIEEQFYLVWPLLVLVGVRVLGGRFGIRVLVGVGVAASLVASWVLVDGGAGIARAYYGTDTRAASILIGAGLATVTAGASRAPSPVERGVGLAAVAAAGVLVASWVVVDGTEVWLYRVGFAGHAVLTALVIAAISGPVAGRLGRVLRSGPLVRVGVLSYGLYLWHWPVYVLLDADRTGLHGPALTAVRVAVSVAVATASYHLLEAPVRSERWRLPRPALASVGAGAAAAAVVVALSWSPGTDPQVAVAGDGPVVPVVEGELLVVGGTPELAGELVAAGADRRLAVRTAEGCVGCGGATERWAELVRLDRPDAVLLLPTPGAEARDLGDGVRRGPCDPTYDLWHREQLRAAVDVLGSSGAVVVLATTASTGDAAADERAGCLDRIADEVTRGFPSELLEVTGADRSAPAATARWMIGELARLTGLEALPFVVVVGDSQALRLVEHAPAFNELDLRVGNLGALGCGLSTQAVVMDGRDVDKSACASTLDGLAGDLATLHPDAVVVHAGVWEALDQSTTDGRIAYPDPRWEARLRANVAATVVRLADDHELIALTTPCFAEGTARDVLGTPDLDARLARYNEVLAGEVERAGGTVVDLADRLCPGGEAVREVDGAEVRPDGVHLDRAGARAVWPWLAEQLRTAVRTAAADPGAIRSDS